ncbi:hypothetical protein Tco_0535292 [Tanacetum coccineum]
MIIARKRVGLLPTHRLVVRYSVNYSSSDHFSSDDSLRDSSSSSSSDHFMILRSRSPTKSVPLSSPISGALSFTRADLLPSPKRIRSPKSVTDLERSDGLDIDPKIQAEIDECFAYADALRARGIDVRVVVEAVNREEVETGTRGPMEVRVDRVTYPLIVDDIPEPAQEGAVEVTYETLGDLVQRFHDHTVEILVHYVERDNIRLINMMDVVSQRVTRSQRRELRVTTPNTQSGASRTRDGGEQEEVNGNRGNGNGGNGNRGANGNGNGNRGGNGYNFGGFMPDRETIGIEAAYAMSWTELMKLMTEVYCPRNEIQKMETEL